MHFDHKYFADKDGIVHGTDGVMGERSQMYCEFNGVFRFGLHELKPADAPITCVTCMSVDVRK